MSKIYLHYDGDLGPDHTFIRRHENGVPFTGRSLGEALVGFVQSYNKKHPAAYNAGANRAVGCFARVRAGAVARVGAVLTCSSSSGIAIERNAKYRMWMFARKGETVDSSLFITRTHPVVAAHRLVLANTRAS